MTDIQTSQPVARDDARRALARLRDGNDRFANNLRSVDALARQAARSSLIAGQNPFAIILSCSDSRVPSEIVFDQGLGDLFVIRVAGNVVAPSLVGSVEFAAATFGTPLVVVMGHSHCGAVTATIDAIQRGGGGSLSANIQDIVERIRPAIEPLVRKGGGDRDALLRAAVRANVRRSVEQLRKDSPVLRERIQRGELAVVGSEYGLDSGRVDFFEGLPA